MIFSLECKLPNVNRCLAFFLIYFQIMTYDSNRNLFQMKDLIINLTYYVSQSLLQVDFTN